LLIINLMFIKLSIWLILNFESGCAGGGVGLPGLLGFWLGVVGFWVLGFDLVVGV